MRSEPATPKAELIITTNFPASTLPMTYREAPTMTANARGYCILRSLITPPPTAPKNPVRTQTDPIVHWMESIIFPREDVRDSSSTITQLRHLTYSDLSTFHKEWVSDWSLVDRDALEHQTCTFITSDTVLSMGTCIPSSPSTDLRPRSPDTPLTILSAVGFLFLSIILIHLLFLIFFPLRI